MKSSEVQPLTTVYRQQSSMYGRGNRAVVLATGNWLAVYGEDRTFRRFGESVTGFRETTEAEKRHSRGLAKGWLVLVVNEYNDAAQALTEADLLALAQPALDKVRAGGVPALPEGVSLDTVRAAEIIDTWADYQQDQEASRIATAAAEARRAETKAAAEAARGRITALVGEETLGKIAYRMDYDEDWLRLEGLLDAYAAAKAGTPVPGA